MVRDAAQGIPDLAHAMPDVYVIVVPHLNLLPRAEAPRLDWFGAMPAAESPGAGGQKTNEADGAERA